jgi:hypothetical protein
VERRESRGPAAANAMQPVAHLKLLPLLLPPMLLPLLPPLLLPPPGELTSGNSSIGRCRSSGCSKVCSMRRRTCSPTPTT